MGRSRPAGDAVHQPSSNEIVEAIVKALSASCQAGDSRLGPAFPHRDQGEDPRTGRNFIGMFRARPGGGASSGGNGYSSIGEWHTVGGLKFGSIEVAEVRFPLYFPSARIPPGLGRRWPISRRPGRLP